MRGGRTEQTVRSVSSEAACCRGCVSSETPLDNMSDLIKRPGRPSKEASCKYCPAHHPQIVDFVAREKHAHKSVYSAPLVSVVTTL